MVNPIDPLNIEGTRAAGQLQQTIQQTAQQELGKNYTPVYNAYQSLNQETVDRITKAVRQNPDLANSPNALYALSNYKVDGTTLGRATQYMQLTDHVRQQMEEQASRMRQSNGGGIHWGGILPSIGRDISGMWGAFKNAIAPKIGLSLGPNASIGDELRGMGQTGTQNLENSFKQTGSGIETGLIDVTNSLGHALARVTDTAAEIASLGSFNPNFSSGSFTNEQFGNIGSSLPDAYDTIKNFNNGVVDLANPFSQNNAFTLMNHTLAFYETLVHQRGSNYALGYITPSIIAGLLTDGALNPAETTAAEGADAGLIARMEQVASQRPLTEEEKIALSEAKARVAEAARPAQERASLLSKMNETRAKYAKIAEGASTPVKYAFKGLRAATKPMSSVRANIGYLTLQEMVQSDPLLKKVWEQTRNGSVYDASGRVVSSVGQGITDAIGLPRGSMVANTMSGLVDLYTKYIGNDPFGVAGKAIGTARSLEGFSGALGALYGGLGIHSADDVYRAYDQYRGFRQAVDYIANSESAGGIMTQFPGLYSREIANELARASTVEEILMIHAKYADAFDMLGSKAPTMGMYSALKATVRDTGVEIGKMLSKDDAFTQHLIEQELEGKFNVRPSDAAFIGTDSPTARWRSIFGRWVLTRLIKNPMYFERLSNAMESTFIRPGDSDAVPAIMNMARLGLLPESQVKFIGDLLLRTKNPDDFVSIYQQLCTHIVYRRVMAGLHEVKYDNVKQTLLDNIWKQVKVYTGVDGGGTKGLFANGEQGLMDSTLENGVHAALDNTGLGRLRFFSAHDIVRLSSRLRTVVRAMEGDAENVTLWMEKLGDEELNASMRILGLNEKNITRVIFDTLQGRVPETEGAGIMEMGGRSAYRTKGTEIAARFRAIMKNKELTRTENLVEFYNYLGGQQRAASTALTAVHDYYRIHGEVEVMSEDALNMFGERMGMPDVGVRGGKIAIDEKLVQKLRGEAAAINDGIAGFHSSLADLQHGTIDQIKSDAAMLRKTRGEITEAEEKALKKWNDKLTEINSTMRKGRNPFQFMVDGANTFLSKLFVPLALFSARWAQHVAVSELALNSFRQGPWKAFDTMVAMSITKHELHGAPLEFLREKKLLDETNGGPTGMIMGHEPSFIRHAVAGALLGFERSILDMSREEAQQMVDNFVSAIMRHNGHTLMEMHGNGTIVDESKANAREKVFNRTDTGTETHSVLYTNDEFTDYNPGDLMHASAMTDNLKEIFNPSNMSNAIVRTLLDIVQSEGNKAYALDPDRFITATTKEVDKWMKSEEGRQAMGAVTDQMNQAFKDLVENSNLVNLSDRQLEALRQEFLASLPDADAIVASSMKDYLRRQFDAQTSVIERMTEDATAINAKIEDINNKIAVELQTAAKRGITIAKIDDATKMALANFEKQYSTLDNQIKLIETEVRDHPFRVIISDTNSRSITDAFKSYTQLIERARNGVKAEKLTAISKLEKLAEEHEKAVELERASSDAYSGTFIYDRSDRPAGTLVHQVRKDNGELYENRILSNALPGSGEVINLQPFRRGMGRIEALEGERSLKDLEGIAGLDKMVRDNNIAHASRVLVDAIKSGQFGMSRSLDETGAVEAWNYLAGEGMLDGFTHYQEYMPLGRTETEVQRAWVRNHYLESASAHDFFEAGYYLPDGMRGFGSFDEFREYYDSFIRAFGTNPAFGDVRSLTEEELAQAYKVIEKDYESVRGGQFDPLRNREFPYDPTNDLGQINRLGEAWAGHFFGGIEPLRNHELEQEIANARAATPDADESTFFGHPSAPLHGDPRFRSAEDVWKEMEAKHEHYVEDQGYRMDYEKKVQERTSLVETRSELRNKINDMRKEALDAGDPTGVSARIDRLERQIKQAESDLVMTEAKHQDALDRQAEIVNTHNQVMMQRAVRTFRREKMSEELKQALLDSKNKALLKRVMPQVRKASKAVATHYAKTLGTGILREGTRKFETQEDIDNLIKQLLPTAREEIAKNPNAERFARNLHPRYYDDVRHSEDPREDWAHALSKHVVETMTGRTASGRILHPELLEQAATGNIMHGQSMADLLYKMGDKAPRNIRGRSVVSGNWAKAGSKTDLLKDVTEYGHNKILAPIVNSMVRTPMWLLEYHQQYQRLVPFIKRGMMTSMEAEVMADYNATLNMSKFVHNPLEKTAWEVNMRAAAPFYFAQNQAWRRAFRLMAQDPGAFERYLKACLGVTNYISVQSGGGNVPSVFIPGSSIISAAAGANPIFAKGIPGLAFGLSADPGSVSSMIPTGADISPVGMLENVIRPAWGPLVTIAAKTFFQNGFFKTNPLAQKYLKGFLGDVSYNSKLIDNIVPSSQFKDYFNAMNSGSSAMVTAQSQVLGNYIDNLYAETRQEVLNKYDWSGMKGSQKDMLVQAYVDYDVSQKLNDPEFRQNLLERAHTAAMWMLLAKATINLVSPLATQLQQRFSLQPELNALIKEKGSIIDAMTAFTLKYPDHMADLVTHTMPTYGPFPETLAAYQMIEKHSDIVRAYPFATAYLASRGAGTDPQALQIEMMQGLRSREAPDVFLQHVRIAIGNDYYYNYLLPKYQQAYGQTTTISLENGQTEQQIGLSYKGAMLLAADAKQYGDNYNPVWYEDHTGANRKDNANQAFEDMKKLLISSASSQIMSADDKKKFQEWVSGYENVQKNVLELRANNNKHEAYVWENWWYATCTAAATDPGLANQAYFISTVLRKMPGT